MGNEESLANQAAQSFPKEVRQLPGDATVDASLSHRWNHKNHGLFKSNQLVIWISSINSIT